MNITTLSRHTRIIHSNILNRFYHPPIIFKSYPNKSFRSGLSFILSEYLSKDLFIAFIIIRDWYWHFVNKSIRFCYTLLTLFQRNRGSDHWTNIMTVSINYVLLTRKLGGVVQHFNLTHHGKCNSLFLLFKVITFFASIIIEQKAKTKSWT